MVVYNYPRYIYY